MKTVRVIPRLDIKGPNLVKGIRLEGLRVLGKPEVFAKYYYENGADELFCMDVVASLYERNSLHDIISRIAKEVHIPMTVGGGLRTLEDIRAALRAGADKVAINTAAIKRSEFITEAANAFGASTILVAIEAIRQPDGRYLAFTDNGREHTGLEVIQWAKRVEELGAGEIVITSVDREGTGEGYDVQLTREVSAAVKIPVIAHGGAGSPNDVSGVVSIASADAVCVASILHYGIITSDIDKSEFLTEGNTEFLTSGRAYKKIVPSKLSDIKHHLVGKGIECRV